MKRPFVDPTAWVAPGALLMGDVTLGRESSVWYTAVIRGDMAPIVIGERSNLQDGTIVHVDQGVPCSVGNRVGVGHRAILHGCTIEDDCLIGMGSILLNGAVVGRGSVVAAGAVIKEGFLVPPGSLVVGMPARVVRQVDSVLTDRIEQTWRHYVAQAARHRGGEFPAVKG